MPFKNKKQQKEFQANHYKKNRDKYRARDKLRLEAGRNYVKKIKQESSCIDCGESRWQCLDFDHIDPSNKTKNLATMVKQRYSIETLQKEIDKCEIRCSNCHRVRSWNEKHYWSE